MHLTVWLVFMWFVVFGCLIVVSFRYCNCEIGPLPPRKHSQSPLLTLYSRTHPNTPWTAPRTPTVCSSNATKPYWRRRSAATRLWAFKMNSHCPATSVPSTRRTRTMRRRSRRQRRRPQPPPRPQQRQHKVQPRQRIAAKR